MLIYFQRPDATQVAGYRTWQALGRQVKAGEHAIWIYAPMIVKQRADAVGVLADGEESDAEQLVTRFRPVPVFDIAQTDGPDLPTLDTRLHGAGDDAVLAALAEFAGELGLTVDLGADLRPGLDGCYSQTESAIKLAAGLDGAQAVRAMAHELGHALLHGPGGRELPAAARELQADSVAFLVLDHCGIDGAAPCGRYLASWGGDDARAALMAFAGEIDTAARRIIAAVESRIGAGLGEGSGPQLSGAACAAMGVA
jgi:hypothetical protein